MDMQNINDLFEAYIAEEDSIKKESLLNISIQTELMSNNKFGTLSLNRHFQSCCLLG